MTLVGRQRFVLQLDDSESTEDLALAVQVLVCLVSFICIYIHRGIFSMQLASGGLEPLR